MQGTNFFSNKSTHAMIYGDNVTRGGPLFEAVQRPCFIITEIIFPALLHVKKDVQIVALPVEGMYNQLVQEISAMEVAIQKLKKERDAANKIIVICRKCQDWVDEMYAIHAMSHRLSSDIFRDACKLEKTIPTDRPLATCDSMDLIYGILRKENPDRKSLLNAIYGMTKEQLADLIRDASNKGIEYCILFQDTKHAMKKYPPTGCSLAQHSARFALCLHYSRSELLHSDYAESWTPNVVDRAYKYVFPTSTSIASTNHASPYSASAADEEDEDGVDDGDDIEKELENARREMEAQLAKIRELQDKVENRKQK
jgi:hypothetical protein